MPNCRARVPLRGLSLLLAFLLLTAGAARPAGVQASPEVVRLGVIVSDSDGRPIHGLTRDDFDVFAWGRRLPVDAFQEVTFEPDDDPSAEEPAGVPRSVGRNSYASDARLLVLVADDGDLDTVQAAAMRERMAAIIGAIETDVPIGLAFSSGAPGVELTLDRTRLLTVVDRIAAGRPDSGATNVLGLLERTAERLGRIERDSRAFLWVTAGPDETGFDPARVSAFIAAAGQGGVSVYSMRGDRGPVSDRDRVIGQVVAATGGVAFGDAPAADVAAVIQSDLAHHYLLTVPVAAVGMGAETGPSGAGQLRVVVRRDEAVTRVRPGYRGAPGVSGIPAVDDVAVLADAVAPTAGVPMSVFAAPFPTGDRDVPVMVTLQMGVPLEPLSAIDPLLGDEVDWTILGVNLDTGEVTRRRTEQHTLALRPRSTDPARHDTVQYELSSWIDLRPGRYQLRVVARSGHLDLGGTVFLSLDVPDFASQPVSVGGMVLGYPITADDRAAAVAGAFLDPEVRRRMGGAAGGGVALSVSDGRVPVRPVLHRDFDRWEELAVFLEVGRRSRGADGTAVVEVLDAAGRVVHRSQPEVGGRGESPVRIDLPLNTFQPGAYRIRARAAAGEARAVGETGFVIRGTPAPLEPADAPVAAAPPVEPPAPAAEVPAAAAPEPAGQPTTLRLRPEGFDIGDSASPAVSSEPYQLARQGWDRYGQGDVEGAQLLLRRAVNLGSEDPWIHYALGLAEFGLMRHQEAATAWEFVRAREPSHQPVYFDLTDAYLSLDRPDDAVAVLKDAAVRWADDSEVHNAMGVVYFGRRQYDEAIAAFEKAVEVAPGDGLGYFNLGQVFQARMVRWQADRSMQMRSATRALADRDRERAIQAFERALALGGSFEWDARQALRMLGGGHPPAALISR